MLCGVLEENQPADPARWFDLSNDPLELRPRADMETGRGREAHMRFLRQLAELLAAKARRPGDPVPFDVPEDLLQELKDLGYYGDDE